MKDEQIIMLLILRERWPVGSKAKFKAIADRVGASHTYHLMGCPIKKVLILVMMERCHQQRQSHCMRWFQL